MEGKIVLVTGASRGIGRLIVQNLIQKKSVAKVHAVCILEAELKELHAEFPDHVIPHLQDLTNWSATEELIASIPEPIDAVVNNAGIAELESLGSISEASVDRQLAVNVKSMIQVMQCVSRKMKETGTRGSIVNLSSQASHTALRDHLVYCASKAAVDGATRSAALELGPYGIRVNSVCPTVTKTAMAMNLWSEEGRMQEMISRIPLRRLAEVQEVVNAILFLLDNDQSSMISGIHLPVDGGFSAA
jgi:L-xylulose reductase